MSRFDRRGFVPLGYSYLKDKDTDIRIQENGYAIVPFLNQNQLQNLQALYEKHHSITDAGAYFSLYNNDLSYRESVYSESLNIINPSLESYFQNYNAGNSGFVVRGPNDEGEFFVHQDPSFVDETKSSPLHVWCPLYDITLDFAPVCVFPKSHHLAAPLRSPTVPFPFNDIRQHVRRYMVPLTVKAGQAIFLDPRLMHNSLPNKRNTARPVLLVQIFQAGENFITPFLNENEIELYQLPENYFLKNTKFYQDVMGRPALGTFIEKFPFAPQPVSLDELETFCKDRGIAKVDYLDANFKDANAIANIGK